MERKEWSFRRRLERRSTGISAAAHHNITFVPPSVHNLQSLYPGPKAQVGLGFKLTSSTTATNQHKKKKKKKRRNNPVVKWEKI